MASEKKKQLENKKKLATIFLNSRCLTIEKVLMV